jgi:hypothetical protein
MPKGEFMAKFRKKPVVIEAIQFTGDVNSAMEFIRPNNPENYPDAECFQVKTLEGVMTASKGDWIIKGIKGEFYPCKPDIFDKTYEAVSE